jgi:hypothetical protein
MAAYIHAYASGAVDLALPPMPRSVQPAVVGRERVSVG